LQTLPVTQVVTHWPLWLSQVCGEVQVPQEVVPQLSGPHARVPQVQVPASVPPVEQTPLTQVWPAAQQLPLQMTWPVWQVLSTQVPVPRSQTCGVVQSPQELPQSSVPQTLPAQSQAA
jgi:hypothetical protein